MTKEPPHLPPVYFDVLSIEEENGGRNKSDVKVLDIHWHTVHINTVDGCHLGQLLCRLGQLVGQCKVKKMFFSFCLCSFNVTLLQLPPLWPTSIQSR